ncbi:MAG TPA: hypothetical protein VKB65_08350 [Myxococcota bacterium]|nr:hypothetical protein [Myxococcota bacterium]
MASPSLAEKVLRLEEGCRARGIPHAFGGALALAYYATPRATIDIDLNVFVAVERADEVLDLLAALGADPLSEAERPRLVRDGQARVRWAGTPVDLFFAYDALHASCLERRRRMPFGDGDAIHVLSAEDLLVFKAVFDREKDWRDLEELAFALGPELDGAYASGWLERIVGESDPRFARVAALLERWA